MHLTLCDIFQRVSANITAQSIRDFTVCTLLSVDIDSVQSAFAKQTLHVASSSLKKQLKDWKFNEFQLHPVFKSHFLLIFRLMESFNIFVSFLRKD